jgi:hypothetical protein
MKTYVCAVVAATMFLAGHGVVCGQTADAPREPRVRTILRTTAPIPSRLEADDEVVVVEKEPGLVIEFEADVSRQKALEFASTHARGAAVVQIDNASGKLVDDDTWIATFTTATVLTTIREPADFPLKEGTQFTMKENAGELAIAGKIVRAGRRVLEPMQPGRTYLVTLTYDPAKGLAYPTGRWLVQEDGSLKDTVLGPPGSDWRQKLTGLSLDGVVDSLRRLRAPRSR